MQCLFRFFFSFTENDIANWIWVKNFFVYKFNILISSENAYIRRIINICIGANRGQDTWTKILFHKEPIIFSKIIDDKFFKIFYTIPYVVIKFLIALLFSWINFLPKGFVTLNCDFVFLFKKYKKVLELLFFIKIEIVFSETLENNFIWVFTRVLGGVRVINKHHTIFV